MSRKKSSDPFQPVAQHLESAGVIPPKEDDQAERGRARARALAAVSKIGEMSPQLNVWKLNGKDCFFVMPYKGVEPEESIPILSESQFKRELRVREISDSRKLIPFSAQDVILRHVQNNRAVSYAGDLAGYKVGVHTVAGRRVAVTGSYRLIEPVAGEWPLIGAFLGRLSRGDVDQRPYFLAWLKQAVMSLRAGERRPGHMLVLTGGANSGKSFTQEYLITPLIGGRAADPRPYLMGESQFSGQIFGCEHLMMQELPAARDPTSRSMLSENLKQLIVNDSVSMRQMYYDAVTVTPYRRVTLSINNNVEKLQGLPALTSDISDKIILLTLSGEPMPMPTRTDEQRVAFRVAFAAELPAFVHHLLNWEMPAELTEGENADRFGLNAWQNPEVATTMFEQEPEFKLLWLIDRSNLFTLGPWGWESASDLQEAITQGPHGAKAGIFKYPGTCGELLGKLRVRYPERFEKKHSSRGNLWFIRPEAE